jgi:hypothetical protein
MKRFSLFALLLGAGLLSLAVAGGAGAASPRIFQGTFHDEFSFDIDCGTFSLREDVVEDGTFQVHFEADGITATRVVVHHHFRGVITNPTTGETLGDPSDYTDFIDFAGTQSDPTDDIVREAGSIFRIHVPGEGIVVHDTGLVIFVPDGTVEIHGPHEQLVAGDALICDQLG